MPELKYPEVLLPLYLPSCWTYRDDFNTRMHKYLATRINTAEAGEEKDYFQRLSQEENLTIPPMKELSSLNFPFDLISASVISPRRKGVMFIQYRSPGKYYQRGVGKTGILLELLGIHVLYEMMPKKLEEIAGERMITFSNPNARFRILSSDMPYVGEKEGTLAIAIPKGEQLIAQWDLVRHIIRVNDKDYYIGKNLQDPNVRAYIEKFGEWCCLAQHLFAATSKVYPIHFIFTVKRIDSLEDKVSIKEGNPAEIKEILNYSPLYHRSPFWGVDRDEHYRRVDNIVRHLRDAPKIVHLEILSKEKYLVKDLANLVLEVLA